MPLYQDGTKPHTEIPLLFGSNNPSILYNISSAIRLIITWTCINSLDLYQVSMRLNGTLVNLIQDLLLGMSL